MVEPSKPQLFPEFDNRKYMDTQDEYWAEWDRENPKPSVAYWADDPEFDIDGRQFQTDGRDGKKEYICPDHGVTNKLTKQSPVSPSAQKDLPQGKRRYESFTYGCAFCDMQQRYGNEPDYAPKFKNEKNPLGLNPYWWNVIYTLAKHGYKGNKVPKDYKALESLFVWRQKKDKAASDWTAYIALHANDFALAAQNVSMILEKVRSGELTVTEPKVKRVGRKDMAGEIEIAPQR
jgi:hypothetical protein